MVGRSVAEEIQLFVAEREWGQFHSPENLAKSIAIEAGELLECFQWNSSAPTGRILDELADVLTYCHLLALRLEADPDQIVRDKLAISRAKYPVDKARGRPDRYDDLPD